MFEVLKQIHKMRIVPVVAIEDAAHAPLLAEALVSGGLPCAEITFRTDAAEEAIRQPSKQDNFLVGAGTVLSIETVKIAMDAGAKFIVSPGLNPKVVGYCCKNNIPVVPGVSTPTEIETALDFGLEVLKYFPAEAFGGIKTLKAISAPYSKVRFIPTGGINAANALDYLKFPKVFAIGGSWMVKSDLITTNNFMKIEKLTKDAVLLSVNAGKLSDI